MGSDAQSRDLDKDIFKIRFDPVNAGRTWSRDAKTEQLAACLYPAEQGLRLRRQFALCGRPQDAAGLARLYSDFKRMRLGHGPSMRQSDQVQNRLFGNGRSSSVRFFEVKYPTRERGVEARTSVRCISWHGHGCTRAMVNRTVERGQFGNLAIHDAAETCSDVRRI